MRETECACECMYTSAQVCARASVCVCVCVRVCMCVCVSEGKCVCGLKNVCRDAGDCRKCNVLSVNTNSNNCGHIRKTHNKGSHINTQTQAQTHNRTQTRRTSTNTNTPQTHQHRGTPQGHSSTPPRPDTEQAKAAAPPVDRGAAGAAGRGQRGDHGGVPEDTTWSDKITDNPQRPKP